MNRRPVPFDLGPVHFVGIGGIGMSAIAEIMLRIGYQVQGSDARAGANTERLERLGAKVFIGHDAAHIAGASALVFTSAVGPDNPELAAARAQRIPLVRRAEMLAELMRQQHSVAVGGTHGKTTTTSMVAAILDAAGFDPTVVNGGIINAYGANAKVGEGDWIVVEADESDGTFLRLRPTVAVVTNIDPEHLDYYETFDAVKRAFQGFVESVPFYGFAAVCIDDPDVQEMAAKVENRRLITYGTNPQAEVRAMNIGVGAEGSTFDVLISGPGEATTVLGEITLPMAGQHNVLNALAAIAIGRELGATEKAIRKGLAGFGGVRRRFTFTGEARGVRVVDDYGHHPVEIANVLKAARAVTNGRVIAVVQPHRYSRLKDLFQEFCRCFNDADEVIVADVYPAGEAPIEGASRDALVEGLKRHGHRHVLPLEGPAALPALIAAEAKSGDLVICLGAGDITAWAQALPGQLAAPEGT
ncbi:MAG TPA: UDP-N-acetylmuramate--L-alanine ligase [Caulobacteraceae bacterium]|nr:UDP-N-acetylmuramate--L-alanine ligase [Caulobacteraceae bacterium]